MDKQLYFFGLLKNTKAQRKQVKMANFVWKINPEIVWSMQDQAEKSSKEFSRAALVSVAIDSNESCIVSERQIKYGNSWFSAKFIEVKRFVLIQNCKATDLNWRHSADQFKLNLEFFELCKAARKLVIRSIFKWETAQNFQ